MHYKTILVHADTAPGAGARLRLAARLARSADAHLIGSAVTGISRFVPPRVIADGGPALAARCEAMRRDAAIALTHFARIAREEDVASTEERLIDDDLDNGIGLQVRYCDLAVVGQGSFAAARGAPGDLPESLLADGARPILVVPAAGCPPGLDGPALVAWDGSMQATRAVTAALPLLRAAAGVTVLACTGHGRSDSDASDACARMIGYLRRHGIDAHPRRRRAADDTGAAILAQAAAVGAGLLVMGAFGHARIREFLLGGTTATVLRSMSTPVLLAH